MHTKDKLVFEDRNLLYFDRSMIHGLYQGYHVVMFEDDEKGVLLHIYGTSCNWNDKLRMQLNNFTDQLMTNRHFIECACINERILMVRVDVAYCSKKRIACIQHFLNQITNFFFEHEFISACFDCDVTNSRMGIAYIENEEIPYQMLCPRCFQKRVDRHSEIRTNAKKETAFQFKPIISSLLAVIVTCTVYCLLAWLNDLGEPALIFLLLFPYLSFHNTNCGMNVRKLCLIGVILTAGFIITEYTGMVVRFMHHEEITLAYACTHVVDYIKSIPRYQRMLCYDLICFAGETVVLFIQSRKLIREDFHRNQLTYMIKDR